MTMATSRADDDDDGADNGGGGDSIPPSAVADDGGEEGPLPATAAATVARSRRREEIQQLLRQQQHPDIGVPSSAYSSPRIMTMGDRSTDDDQDNIDEVDKTAIVAGEGGRQQQRQLDNDGDDDDLLFPGGRVLRNSQRLFTRLDSDENNEMATLFHSTSTASGTLAGQNIVGIGNNNNNNAGGGIATPLLNGENIVLLSYSNETTPSGQLTMSAIADQLYGDDDNNGGVAGIRQRRRSHPQRIIADESDQIRNSRDDMPQSEELHTEDHEEGDQDMTLSPNSFIGDLESTDVMMMASSPPPESVHSGVLTSLSPPPLSIKSAGGGAGGGGGVGPYYVPPSSSGSVGLFSRGEHPPASSVVSGGVGSGVGGGGNGLNYGAAPPKENWRPPLPPRWAIPGGGGTQGTAGLASPHHGGVAAGPPPPQPQQQQTRAVDVVPTHLPPLPKQIGQLHHRRVLSTGDASLLSNLTDPDSIPDLGEEHSPTQPPGSTTFATANNTGAGGGNGGMERAFFPVVPGPSQTTTSLSAKPLTMNPPHRRGVSWAAFGGSDGGGGDGDAWLSSSYSLNRFRSEEEATFDTLGILQPILHDGDGDEDINKFLMQPVLGDENDNMAVAQQPAMIGGMGSAFESANAAAVGVDTTVPPSPLPPPPPPASPPERVTRILDDESNNQSTAKKRERNISQFEYEAQMAILEALNEQQNMTSIDMRDHPMYAEDASGERIEEPAPDIEPDFQSWISPNSAEGSLPLDQQHDNSRSLFENSAWTSEYDARGRIDGTLPEERDAKLVEIDMKQLVDDVPSVAVIKSHAPTVQEQTATDKESDNSPRSILKSHDAAKDINVPTDGTDATGLRHRKVKSIAAKSMADELAALAAMHGGVTKTDAPALTKDGGIDNLLAGVVSLAQQEGGKHQSQEQPTTSANANDSDGDAGEEDSPRDEETGDAKQIIRGDNAGYNFGASGGWSSRSSLGRQGSEKLYYLRGWYHELIKPKLPAFWTGATHFVCFTMLPLLTVAFILYYAAGNPTAGGATVEAIMDATEGLDNYEYASWQVTSILV